MLYARSRTPSKQPEPISLGYNQGRNMETHQNQGKESASISECAPADMTSPHRHDHSTHAHSVNGEDTTGSRLLITLAINLLIPAAQIGGGVYAHSMALISDAVHTFSDFTALLIAYFAFRIGKRGASPENTFGYGR